MKDVEAHPFSSLEYRLPLLISALLLALVLTGSIMAYREVRQSALVAAEERLDRVSRQLSEIVATGLRTRIALMKRIAAEPPLAILVAGGTADSAATRVALEQLELNSDTFPIELWRGDRSVVARAGRYPADWSAAQQDSARQITMYADSGGYSEIISIGGQAFVWVVAPLTGGGEPASTLAQLRPVGNPGTSRQLTELVGPGATIHFANTSDRRWVSLSGEMLDAPVEPTADVTLSFTTSDSAYIGRSAEVPGAPFVIVAASPLAEALLRANVFARRLIIGAILLTLLGTIAAWLVSKRITQPVRELGRAASDIASGDYTRRVASDRRDELGALARAFSQMAAEVQTAHGELRAQYEAERNLAAKLEAANQRLSDAMAVADHARSEAETASRAKSEFLATMSHEIRTPINAIVGYTDLMQLEISGPLTELQHQQLERVRTSGQHLISLVDDVLDLARIESGNFRISERAAHADDAIESAIAVIAPDVERKAITLSRDGIRDVRYVGDSQRLRQVLINLLTNAVKFTPAGGRIDVSVAVQPAEHSDGWVVIKVRDTGVGIAPEQLEQIFEPFMQGERGYTRSHGGVGLGLAISRHLARMMGGEIDVESTPGKGSTFSVRLPLAEEGEVRAAG